MLTFQQFLQDTAAKGRTINTLFEERLFTLAGTLERIAAPLAAAKIPYEVIGGMAVMVQIDRVEPAAVRNSKDIDIMINRADLERTREIVQIDSHTSTVLNPVHLVFSGEKTKANQAMPNPPLRPEHVSVHGVQVAVIPVMDLVAMKLANNRDIDRVHVRDLDSVGLVTPEIEKALPAPLHARLQGIRSSE